MKEIFAVLAVCMILFSGCIGTQESSLEEIMSEGPEGGALEPAVCTVGVECGDGEHISIPLSELSSGAEHYSYEHEGTEVRYFAVLGQDGEPRVAFDACEVCFAAGKGYSQSGDSVTCNNCGLKFRIEGLGEENKGAGCWPAHLEHSIEDGKILIRKSDLAGGAYLFS